VTVLAVLAAAVKGVMDVVVGSEYCNLDGLLKTNQAREVARSRRDELA